MEHTIITVLVTLLICGIVMAIVQVYRKLKGRIDDLDNHLHTEMDYMKRDANQDFD